jgi:hypothetical protein
MPGGRPRGLAAGWDRRLAAMKRAAGYGQALVAASATSGAR